MHGVPEVSAAVRSSIVASMVKVDIADVVRELVPERPPPALARRQEPCDQARDGIVLIVVMGNERRVASGRFVIGVQLAEVTPPEFVDAFAARSERRRKPFAR